MMRFRLPLLVLSSLFLLTDFSHGQSGTNRVKYNSDWKVLVGDPQGADQPGFDDSQWKRVTTPYAWNEDSAFRVSIHDLPTGVAWYRKHFRLPAGSAGQKIFIEFEGIRQAGEVYLNGKFIGRHEDGVMAFGWTSPVP
jgi:beta-galactosidase/beta-glucuronidase